MARYPDPIITRTAIIISLHEPIYGSYFGIWDKWIRIAKERNLNIIVTTPFGKATYTYGSYMDGAKKIERYYKNPNVPMIFYCRDFKPDIELREKRKKAEEKIEMSTNTVMTGLAKIRKNDPEFYASLRSKLGLR